MLSLRVYGVCVCVCVSKCSISGILDLSRADGLINSLMKIEQMVQSLTVLASLFLVVVN